MLCIASRRHFKPQLRSKRSPYTAGMCHQMVVILGIDNSLIRNSRNCTVLNLPKLQAR